MGQVLSGANLHPINGSGGQVSQAASDKRLSWAQRTQFQDVPERGWRAHILPHLSGPLGICSGHQTSIPTRPKSIKAISPSGSNLAEMTKQSPILFTGEPAIIQKDMLRTLI